MDNNSIPWYKRKELIGCFAIVGLGLSQFPSYTTANKVGTFITGSVGIAITWFGIKQGYQSDNLPSGITKIMDKVPDSITGVKGSKS